MFGLFPMSRTEQESEAAVESCIGAVRLGADGLRGLAVLVVLAGWLFALRYQGTVVGWWRHENEGEGCGRSDGCQAAVAAEGRPCGR